MDKEGKKLVEIRWGAFNALNHSQPARGFHAIL
jgi:hypothetical protein